MYVEDLELETTPEEAYIRGPRKIKIPETIYEHGKLIGWKWKEVNTSGDKITLSSSGPRNSIAGINNALFHTSQPVYVSLTVIQRRIHNLFQTLKNLLLGTFTPTKIYVFIYYLI
jgi:hypothetical protein